jgi:predicted short-subunit dehydrogenase-like oxidoreductase (DUF2520 family)
MSAPLGLPAAITGPVAHGDAETARRHLEALRAVAPELAEVYEPVAGVYKQQR